MTLQEDGIHCIVCGKDQNQMSLAHDELDS
jgi:hypothetical protein